MDSPLRRKFVRRKKISSQTLSVTSTRVEIGCTKKETESIYKNYLDKLNSKE